MAAIAVRMIMHRFVLLVERELSEARTSKATAIVFRVAAKGHEHGFDNLTRGSFWPRSWIQEPLLEFRAAHKK